MLRQSVRRLTSTARKAAEVASKVDMSNQYGVHLAKVQGHVDGFVGGELSLKILCNMTGLTTVQPLAILPSFASKSFLTRQAARSWAKLNFKTLEAA